MVTGMSDIAELLDEVYQTLLRYVIFPAEHVCRQCFVSKRNTKPQVIQGVFRCDGCFGSSAWNLSAVAVTLWIAASHAQPAWEHATRLVIKSPLKRCGKSRLLDLVAALAHNVLMTVNISVAALVRCISETDPPVVVVDEADTIFAKRRGERSESSEDLRGILNAGHQRGRPYLRWDMNARKLDECPTFAMAAIAGIGDMPDTIEDRAVVITMRRRMRGETVTPFRSRRDNPRLCDLRERLHARVSTNIHTLVEIEPTLPVEDRAADTWEPLVAIADLAGGHWPDIARAVCTIMTSQAVATDDTTLGERLLADLRQVFDDPATKSMWTTQLVEQLAELDEAPWATYRDKRKDPKINSREIGYLLRPYGIKSRVMRSGNQTRRGYHRDDLADAWDRYLTPPTEDPEPAPRTQSDTSETPQHTIVDQQLPVTFPNDTLPTHTIEGGQVFANTAAWDAAGRPGLNGDQPTHRCGKCGFTGRPPRLVTVYPHSGCGGLWETVT